MIRMLVVPGTQGDTNYLNSIFIGADDSQVFIPEFSPMDIKAIKTLYPN